MIRFFLFLSCIIIFSSCTFWQQKEEVNLSEAVNGDWLILYPDHDLINGEQRRIYSEAQDSIVALFGLKTISFRQDGSFLQTDSIFKPAGKWHFNAESNKLFIRNGGKGLDFFQGNVVDIKKDTMRIVENISLNGQNIKLTWYLKRIADKKRSVLFAEDENWWRKKTGPENDSQLKKRIKALLAYYSLYYEMVSKESAYFSQARVFLPFRYYQHSMGLKAFDHKGNFSQLFFNTQQAEQAHAILSGAITKLQNEPFPSGEDFVIEYAKFINKLAGVIEN
jgi:hypothetical protein